MAASELDTFDELVKGWLTGTEPDLGTMHAVKAPGRGA
jgi:hypothetical protein